jgi:hypothetical protein
MKLTVSLVLFSGMLCAGTCESMFGISFPLGVPLQENSGMSLAMGGAACAVASDQDVMLRNPANLGTIDKMVFSGLYAFDITRLSAGSFHSNLLSSYPTQLSASVPLGVAGTIALSYSQRSDGAASFQVDTSLVFNSTAVIGRRGFAAGGGLSAWQAGWGRSIGKWARFGVCYERLYLSTHRTVLSTTIDNISGEVSARDSTYVSSSINGLRLGVMVPVRALKIGASAEYFYSAGGQSARAVYTNGSIVPVEGSTQLASFTLRLPPTFTLGVSYDISPAWLVASDLNATFWDSYRSGGVLPETKAGTALGFCAGTQYVPAPNLLTPRYWEIIRYRAGLRFNQLPSKDAWELLGCLGFGLPVGRTTGILDISIEAGTRRSAGFLGLSENVVHVGLGISGGHKWSKASGGNY